MIGDPWWSGVRDRRNHRREVLGRWRQFASLDAVGQLNDAGVHRRRDADPRTLVHHVSIEVVYRAVTPPPPVPKIGSTW